MPNTIDSLSGYVPPREQKSMSSAKPLVTIICPVYNEEECIPLFFERLKTSLTMLRSDYDFELIFTNNCSADRSLEEIQKIHATEPWVKVISLSRNFGYQASIMCGLRNAAGEVIIFIDVDCEDPPEMISQFLHHWREGYDIVYGRRAQRVENQAIMALRKIFYRLTRAIADSEFVLDMADFSLISHRVRDVCLRNQSSYPFIRSEIGYAGFKRYGIRYTRAPRIAGRTHYNLLRMTSFAIAGILSASTFPLRIAVYCGLPLAALNFLTVAVYLLTGPFDLQPVVLLDFAVLLVAVSGLSLFIARIYKDVVQRPLYIVDSDHSLLDRGILADDGTTVLGTSSQPARRDPQPLR
jgi:dolichol-phosphate mannosyltransferase